MKTIAPSRLRKRDYICSSCVNTQWRKANPEKNRANLAAWREANRDHLRAYEAARYAADPEHHRARQRERMDTPEGRVKRARWQQCRNARALGVGGNDLTDNEWLWLVEQVESLCLGCGRDDVPLTRDHVVPVTAGGSLTLENVQPLCRGCNARKKCQVIDYRPPELLELIQLARGVTPSC